MLAPRLLPIRASSPLNANPLGEMRPHASVMAAALLSFQSRDVPDTAGDVRHAAINIEGESSLAWRPTAKRRLFACCTGHANHKVYSSRSIQTI